MRKAVLGFVLGLLVGTVGVAYADWNVLDYDEFKKLVVAIQKIAAAQEKLANK